MRLREERQRLIDAESDAKTTLYALKRILNLSDGEQIEFTDRQNFFATPSLDISDPLSRALEQRPELRSLSENIKAAQLAHQVAVAQSLPNLASMVTGICGVEISARLLPDINIARVLAFPSSPADDSVLSGSARLYWNGRQRKGLYFTFSSFGKTTSTGDGQNEQREIQFALKLCW